MISPHRKYLDQDKYRDLDPKVYLDAFYTDPEEQICEMEQYVDFFKPFLDGSLKILEYAGGPTLLYLLPMAPKASEIVFAEFAEKNRKEVQRWLDRDPRAFSWSTLAKLVLHLEGKAEEGAEQREECLRTAIKAVVSCDLAANPLVEKGYEGPYDLVHCAGTLDAICQTHEQFAQGVQKLTALVKKGGKLMLLIDLASEVCSVGGVDFDTPLILTPDGVRQAFEGAGLGEIQSNVFKVQFKQASYEDTGMLIVGTKL